MEELIVGEENFHEEALDSPALKQNNEKLNIRKQFFLTENEE